MKVVSNESSEPRERISLKLTDREKVQPDSDRTLPSYPCSLVPKFRRDRCEE